MYSMTIKNYHTGYKVAIIENHGTCFDLPLANCEIEVVHSADVKVLFNKAIDMNAIIINKLEGLR